MHLVEVAFKGNRKEFFSWEGETPPPVRASVVVEADRGEDLGVVHAIGEQAEKRCAGCAHGVGAATPTRRAIRIASTHDLRQSKDLRAQDEAARQKGMERVKAHGLVMKLSDAEWQWDRKKLTFYFTAEKRVDFRNLVRDLAALFRARIELKQIGVRDEAKRLDGIGRCGRQFCSASWLPELRPVNLGVAKDQRLSLNPSQISGACGRLMCCLRYEHEFYVQSRKRFPKDGKTLVTVRGEEKVVSNDIFNERVTLRSSEGEIRVVTLTQLRRDLAAAGHPAAGGADTIDGSAIGDPSAEDLSGGSSGDVSGDMSDGAMPDGLASLLDEHDTEFGGGIVEQAELEDAIEDVLEIERDADDGASPQRPSTTGRRQSRAAPARPPRAQGPAKDSPRPRARSQRSTERGDVPPRAVETRSVTPAANPRRGLPASSGDSDSEGDPSQDQRPESGETAGAEIGGGEGAGVEVSSHEPEATSSPRRRRGRRGGRRGRGKSGAGTSDGTSAAIAPEAPGASRAESPGTAPPVGDSGGHDDGAAPAGDC